MLYRAASLVHAYATVIEGGSSRAAVLLVMMKLIRFEIGLAREIAVNWSLMHGGVAGLPLASILLKVPERVAVKT